MKRKMYDTTTVHINGAGGMYGLKSQVEIMLENPGGLGVRDQLATAYLSKSEVKWLIAALEKEVKA